MDKLFIQLSDDVYISNWPLWLVLWSRVTFEQKQKENRKAGYFGEILHTHLSEEHGQDDQADPVDDTGELECIINCGNNSERRCFYFM